MKYAEILFQQKVGEGKDTLTYSIPERLNTKIGQSAMVTIRNRPKAGIVWDIHEKKPPFRTQAIKEIIHEKPLLSQNQIETIKWMSKYYFCPIFKILKLFIYKRILDGNPVKSRTKELEQISRSESKELTAAQKEAIHRITTENVNNFLIHGVTGSGKTEIYSRLAKHQLEKNKQTLILVPEISLTPQIIEYFEQSLGIRVTVIHSKLSLGERHKAWKDIWKNKAKLVIGSRSALFSPFQELGMIIIDEEHEFSYKQDNSPRYTTHRVIEKMQTLDPSLKAVYGSATPSIESSEKFKDSIIRLEERIGNATLPEVTLVDLREEFKKKNYSIFSDKLREEITKTLKEKQQALLFINRRGAASSVVCRDCGISVNCDDCEIPMTYHAKTMAQPKLICHHCGKISAVPSSCPGCKGINIRYLGIGTQKIEAELLKEFPNARVLRADKDTTSKKNSFKEIYTAFRNHEADILIGTQMIAKGLHLPMVNLVGVIIADIGLNIPDFRSTERNFQLLTQVAGRAGRGESKGKVIIQTYNPDNIALVSTKSHNTEGFLKYERTQRKILRNPPFSKIAKILIENPSLENCKARAEQSAKKLKAIMTDEGMEKIEINSYPAYLTRLRNKYRFIVLIKSEKEEQIHYLLEKLPKEYIMDPNFKIDVDPISIT